MTDKPHKLPSNFNVLTFTTPCPSCGAPVEFVSAGSVMAVCEYCQTTVVRQGEQITTQGKQSLTIEDYSPLQIGSVGTYQNNQFAVVGRIQMEYSEGIWNEWYIQFANGHNGWLSEALGQYSLSLNKGEQPHFSNYHQLAINQTINFEDIVYTINDKRDAIAIAGEGELPFVMGKGWQTWVIDARQQRNMITLDYGEHGAYGVPIVFQGVAIPLENLQMQMLKDSSQVNQSSSSAGYGGLGLGSEANSNSNNNRVDASHSTRQQNDQVGKIDCPSCGSPVPFVAGVTSCLMCPACHSEIKMTGANAEVVKTHSMMQSFKSSLQLGAKARINASEIDVSQFSRKSVSSNNVSANISSTDVSSLDAKFSSSGSNERRTSANSSTTGSSKKHDYIVVGVQRLQEVGSYARWTEYLLYSFTDGFLWLSEEPKKGWMLSRVLNDFPTREGKSIRYDGRKWKEDDGSYQSRVIFAIGAFNWQVKVDDYMDLTDYIHGKEVITAEQNESEISYTISSPVSDGQMATWFGSQYVKQASSKNFGEYNPNNYSGKNWDSDEWEDGDSVSPKSIILFGIAGSYFLLFLGSIGAFILSLILAVVGFFILGKVTDDEDTGYSMAGYVVAIMCVILAVVMNSVLFEFSEGSSGIYYSSNSSSRTGYSSSGSHK